MIYYQEQLKDRIRLTIIEQLQDKNVFSEPENYIPNFVEKLTNRISEIVLDELTYYKGRIK